MLGLPRNLRMMIPSVCRIISANGMREVAASTPDTNKPSVLSKILSSPGLPLLILITTAIE